MVPHTDPNNEPNILQIKYKKTNPIFNTPKHTPNKKNALQRSLISREKIAKKSAS